MKILLLLVRIFLQEEGIDMMIKLFAIDLYYGRMAWSSFVKKGFSEFINNKTKEQLAIMCDEELLAEILTS
ncbi:TPA: hypothetical protein ACIZSV_000610 [Streptococcus agalactiae]